MEKKRGEYNKKKESFKFIIATVILVLFILILYFGFLKSTICKDDKCFYNSIISCKRASYVFETEESTWKYEIKGITSGKCETKVEFLQAKKGGLEIEQLEGKSMQCMLPLGVLMNPEDDLENCHGELKENLQELIIKKMHSYLLENLQDINTDINEILSG